MPVSTVRIKRRREEPSIPAFYIKSKRRTLGHLELKSASPPRCFRLVATVPEGGLLTSKSEYANSSHSAWLSTAGDAASDRCAAATLGCELDAASEPQPGASGSPLAAFSCGSPPHQKPSAQTHGSALRAQLPLARPTSWRQEQQEQRAQSRRQRQT
eukprot:556973-Pleurochrysis_carterae.AAC.2